MSLALETEDGPNPSLLAFLTLAMPIVDLHFLALLALPSHFALWLPSLCARSSAEEDGTGHGEDQWHEQGMSFFGQSVLLLGQSGCEACLSGIV